MLLDLGPLHNYRPVAKRRIFKSVRCPYPFFNSIAKVSMNPELAQQLESLLVADIKAKNAAKERATENINVAANNLADFEAKKDSVIRPALNEIAAQYEAKGLFCVLDERVQGERPGGGVELPRIGLDLGGPDYRDRTMRPAFTLSFDKKTRKLNLYTSTGSQAGPGPEVTLDEITAEWVHTEFLKYKSRKL